MMNRCLHAADAAGNCDETIGAVTRSYHVSGDLSWPPYMTLVILMPSR